MAPLKKKKKVDSLEDKCLKVFLQSVISDLYLIHLLKRDLSCSMLLSQLRNQSNQELLLQTSQRLQVLPGILNDQVREKLITAFYGNDRNELEKFPGINLDLLKVILNDSILKLDIGMQKLPSQALAVIGIRCPLIQTLKISLDDVMEYRFPTDSDVDSLDLHRARLKYRYLCESKLSSNRNRDELPPKKKRRKSCPVKTSKVPIETPIKEMNFQHLREATILHGASNDLLKELGQNAHNLKVLKICYSFSVTDIGVKKLCLRNPENHGQRGSCQLHELRVRSFHLSPCCRTLTELDITGTSITHFGVAFMLKYLPHLQCFGDCSSVTDALEVLVGNKLKVQYKSLPVIRAHPSRYKLVKMREENVTSQKFMLLTSLCPDLGELHMSNTYKEIDLGSSIECLMHLRNVSGHIGQLKHLKSLSICNIQMPSVLEATQAVGHQLTYLRILCKNLNLAPVLSQCANLSTFILEGSHISASHEALEYLRSVALKKLEVVKIRPTLPTEYNYMILANSKLLREVEIGNLGQVDDDSMDHLINEGHFKLLKSFWVRKAPSLSIKTATALVQKCPKLQALKDLGGWNISCIQYCKLQNDIEKENFEISLYFGYNNRETESDEESAADSDYGSNLIDAFRNIFPVVII